MTQRYDAVVIGGGHNGLTAACYLAGAGLSVAVLERASVVGGAAVTEELIPGFRVSTGSYVLSLMPRRILDEPRKPGLSSSVTAAPPTTPARSRTATDRPAPAREHAATRPL